MKRIILVAALLVSVAVPTYGIFGLALPTFDLENWLQWIEEAKRDATELEQMVKEFDLINAAWETQKWALRWKLDLYRFKAVWGKFKHAPHIITNWHAAGALEEALNGNATEGQIAEGWYKSIYPHHPWNHPARGQSEKWLEESARVQHAHIDLSDSIGLVTFNQLSEIQKNNETNQVIIDRLTAAASSEEEFENTPSRLAQKAQMAATQALASAQDANKMMALQTAQLALLSKAKRDELAAAASREYYYQTNYQDEYDRTHEGRTDAFYNSKFAGGE